MSNFPQFMTSVIPSLSNFSLPIGTFRAAPSQIFDSTGLGKAPIGNFFDFIGQVGFPRSSFLDFRAKGEPPISSFSGFTSRLLWRRGSLFGKIKKRAGSMS